MLAALDENASQCGLRPWPASIRWEKMFFERVFGTNSRFERKCALRPMPGSVFPMRHFSHFCARATRFLTLSVSMTCQGSDLEMCVSSCAGHRFLSFAKSIQTTCLALLPSHMTIKFTVM